MVINNLLKRDVDIEEAELSEASRTQLALEIHLESWLERRMGAIVQERSRIFLSVVSGN